jgi:hypothetical protein
VLKKSPLSNITARNFQLFFQQIQLFFEQLPDLPTCVSQPLSLSPLWPPLLLLHLQAQLHHLCLKRDLTIVELQPLLTTVPVVPLSLTTVKHLLIELPAMVLG